MKTCSWLSQMFKMLKTLVMLLVLCLVGAAEALYKQWIPDTNYENKTNWDKGDVPCGNDIVQFSAQRQVSVFVETSHAVQEMRMPLDGEFILNSGAGFYVLAGPEPGCSQGVTTKFKDSDNLQWFNPALWQAAATLDDLQRGNSLFAVHEESVPCQYDDVVFKTLSSFRVDTSSSQSNIPVTTVSVQGKVFDSRSEFSQYLSSRSGRLQFHGSTAVTAGNPRCEDPSGCECRNSVNHQQICSSVTCGSLNCKMPLQPVGHCCKVCGAILTIQYAAGFNLQTYRQRIYHLFLIQSKYKTVQLGMSKILKPQRLMGIIPFGAFSEIQVAIMDEEQGEISEALALEIVNDARIHGSNLGITGAEFQASSGGSSDQSGGSAGLVVGILFGVLLMIALVFILVLVRKGIVQMPSIPSLGSLKRSSNNEELGGPLDHGFDNPMFDKPNMLPDIPGLYETNTNSISMTQTGVYFVNPVFDEHETDLSA